MLHFAGLYWDKSIGNLEGKNEASCTTPLTPLAWLHAASLHCPHAPDEAPSAGGTDVAPSGTDVAPSGASGGGGGGGGGGSAAPPLAALPPPPPGYEQISRNNGYVNSLLHAWGAAQVGAYSAAPSPATLGAVRTYVRSPAFLHLAVDGLDAPEKVEAGLTVWTTEEGGSCAMKVSCSETTVVMAWTTRDSPCFGAGMGLSSSLQPAQLRETVLSLGKETWSYLIGDEEDY